MGRWIIEQGGLPQTDPFSWTYSVYPNGCPFVVHQWLTDIIFFAALKMLRANSLVLITATTLCLSFLILILQTMKLLRLGQTVTLCLLSLSLLAATAHLQVRPEIFSYVFISLYYFILLKADHMGKLTTESLIILTLSMILWCNLHSGFVAGLIIICFWLLFSLIDQIVFHKSTLNNSYFFALPLCFTATLINPVGCNLWLYLPALYFSPISHYIDEWRHIDLSFFRYDPFYALLILITIFALLAHRIVSTGKLKDTGLKPIALGAIAIVISFCVCRFMNIASMSLIIAIAMLLNKLNQAKNQNENSPPQSPSYVYSLSFGISSTFIVLATTIIIMDRFPAKIAVNYDEFSMPVGAIDFLKQHPQKGRLLNDPENGDVLVWYLQPCPKIFVDSRFDLYSPAMLDKYFKLIACNAGWQDDLQSFNIDWLFVGLVIR